MLVFIQRNIFSRQLKEKKKMTPLILPKLSLMILVLCLLLSFDQHKHTTTTNTTTTFNFINTIPLHSFSSGSVSLSVINNHYPQSLLQYDFYRNSCPRAERIVRSAIHQIHKTNPSLIPALIRLAFHDCFIQVLSFFPFSIYFVIVIW